MSAGVGMLLRTRADGFLEVTEIVPHGSVARSSQVQLGDILKTVDGKAVGTSVASAKELLCGPPGTTVVLEMTRAEQSTVNSSFGFFGFGSLDTFLKTSERSFFVSVVRGPSQTSPGTPISLWLPENHATDARTNSMGTAVGTPVGTPVPTPVVTVSPPVHPDSMSRTQFRSDQISEDDLRQAAYPYLALSPPGNQRPQSDGTAQETPAASAGKQRPQQQDAVLLSHVSLNSSRANSSSCAPEAQTCDASASQQVFSGDVPRPRPAALVASSQSSQERQQQQQQQQQQERSSAVSSGGQRSGKTTGWVDSVEYSSGSGNPRIAGQQQQQQQQQHAAAEQQQRLLASALAAAEELQAANTQVLRDREQLLRDKVHDAAELASLRLYRDKSAAQLQAVQAERSHIFLQLQQLQQTQAGLAQQKEAMTAERDCLAQQLAACQGPSAVVLCEREREEAEIHELRRGLEACKAELQACKKQLHEQLINSRNDLSNLDRALAEKSELESRRAADTEELASTLQAQQEEAEQQREAAEGALRELRAARAELEDCNRLQQRAAGDCNDCNRELLAARAELEDCTARLQEHARRRDAEVAEAVASKVAAVTAALLLQLDEARTREAVALSAEAAARAELDTARGDAQALQTLIDAEAALGQQVAHEKAKLLEEQRELLALYQASQAAAQAHEQSAREATQALAPLRRHLAAVEREVQALNGHQKAFEDAREEERERALGDQRERGAEVEQLRYERETLSAIVSMHVAEIAELKEKGHETERQLARARRTAEESLGVVGLLQELKERVSEAESVAKASQQQVEQSHLLSSRLERDIEKERTELQGECSGLREKLRELQTQLSEKQRELETQLSEKLRELEAERSETLRTLDSSRQDTARTREKLRELEAEMSRRSAAQAQDRAALLQELEELKELKAAYTTEGLELKGALAEAGGQVARLQACLSERAVAEEAQREALAALTQQAAREREAEQERARVHEMRSAQELAAQAAKSEAFAAEAAAAQEAVAAEFAAQAAKTEAAFLVQLKRAHNERDAAQTERDAAILERTAARLDADQQAAAAEAAGAEAQQAREAAAEVRRLYAKIEEELAQAEDARQQQHARVQEAESALTAARAETHELNGLVARLREERERERASERERARTQASEAAVEKVLCTEAQTQTGVVVDVLTAADSWRKLEAREQQLLEAKEELREAKEELREAKERICMLTAAAATIEREGVGRLESSSRRHHRDTTLDVRAGGGDAEREREREKGMAGGDKPGGGGGSVQQQQQEYKDQLRVKEHEVELLTAQLHQQVEERAAAAAEYEAQTEKVKQQFNMKHKEQLEKTAKQRLKIAEEMRSAFKELQLRQEKLSVSQKLIAALEKQVAILTDELESNGAILASAARLQLGIISQEETGLRAQLSTLAAAAAAADAGRMPSVPSSSVGAADAVSGGAPIKSVLKRGSVEGEVPVRAAANGSSAVADGGRQAEDGRRPENRRVAFMGLSPEFLDEHVVGGGMKHTHTHTHTGRKSAVAEHYPLVDDTVSL